MRNGQRNSSLGLQCADLSADYFTVDAFDSDVLIYVTVPGHGLRGRVRGLFPEESMVATGAVAASGSVRLQSGTSPPPERGTGATID